MRARDEQRGVNPGYNGVDLARSPFYLKELEFRYNYRDFDLNDRLIETLGEYTRVAVTEQSPKK